MQLDLLGSLLHSNQAAKVCSAFFFVPFDLRFYDPNFLPGWVHSEIRRTVVARVG
jgi:hypothetical protein